MNNTSQKEIEKNNEFSVWEILNLFRKNWLLVTIVIVLVVSVGLFYSFAVEEQGNTTYYSSVTVLFKGWDYYPPQLVHTYTSDLKAAVNEKAGGNYISTISMKVDTTAANSSAKRSEYYIIVNYASGISLSQAEEASREIAEWHNNMIDTEVQNIKTDAQEHLSLIYEEYEAAELNYHTFLSTADMSDANDLAESSVLESEKDTVYEIWKEEKSNLLSLNAELSQASDYYISAPAVSSSVYISWKSNLILSIFIGFAAAVLLILAKESLKIYKNSK